MRIGAVSSAMINYALGGTLSEITMETRREGREYIESKTAKIEARILETLALAIFSSGATAGEISDFTGISLNNVRSRLTELQDRLRVVPIGKKINPKTMVRVAIWALRS